MNQENNHITNKKPRSKKLSPKIDLTAMVSISFLLIIFFMLTIELSKPKGIELGLPESYKCHPGVIICGGNTKSRTITLLLDGNNKVISYIGYLGFPEEKPKILDYGKNGIRKELLSKNKQIQQQYAPCSKYNSGAIVIIKPNKKSNFKNLIDILDEMSITNIPTYAIINDYSAEEVKLLKSI